VIDWMKDKAWVAFLIAIVINIYAAGFWTATGIIKYKEIKSELSDCRLQEQGYDN
jgi:hypothetical protein